VIGWAMTEETLRFFLDRRERELLQQISAMEAEIAHRRAELDEIHTAKASLPPIHEAEVSDSGSISDAQTQSGVDALANSVFAIKTAVDRTARAFAEASENYPFLQFERLTIKELVIKALTDHFRDGATAVELGDFLRNAYGRPIERPSLSPQLSRLRDDGRIEQLPGAIWKLTKIEIIPGAVRRALEPQSGLVIEGLPTLKEAMAKEENGSDRRPLALERVPNRRNRKGIPESVES
jgi:hypothetical protein